MNILSGSDVGIVKVHNVVDGQAKLLGSWKTPALSATANDPRSLEVVSLRQLSESSVSTCFADGAVFTVTSPHSVSGPGSQVESSSTNDDASVKSRSRWAGKPVGVQVRCPSVGAGARVAAAASTASTSATATAADKSGQVDVFPGSTDSVSPPPMDQAPVASTTLNTPGSGGRGGPSGGGCRLTTARMFVRDDGSLSTKLVVAGYNVLPKLLDFAGSDDLKPIWSAKNRKDGQTKLEMPVRVTAVAGWTQTNDSQLVSVDTQGKMLFYDVRAQRRPCKQWTLSRAALTAVAVDKDLQNKYLCYGDATGLLALFDVRMERTLGRLHGAVGSIQSIVYGQGNRVAAGGLDRYVRVFDKQTRRPIVSVYTKQKQTSILFLTDDPVTEQQSPSQTAAREQGGADATRGAGNSAVAAAVEQADDAVWDALPSVAATSSPSLKKRRKK